MASSKAVAKVEEHSTAVAQNYDYGDFGGEGFDKRSADDISIPFLSILQPLSPQVAEGTVDGARAGMIANTVTNELYDGDTGVRFLWCYDDKKFVEWIPKEKGGGIAGMHEPGSQEVNRAINAAGSKVGKLKIGENDLIETRYVYGLTLDSNDEVTGFAVIAAKSTNLKPVKDWYSSMMFVKGKPPIFAFRAMIKTAKQKNEKGTWFQLHADPVGGNWKSALINPETQGNLLMEAKSFRDMIVSGRAKADFTQEGKAATEAGEDKDVPF